MSVFQPGGLYANVRPPGETLLCHHVSREIWPDKSYSYRTTGRAIEGDLRHAAQKVVAALDPFPLAAVE